MSVETERFLLYSGIGFLGALYMMSHYPSLRPVPAQSMFSVYSDKGEYIGEKVN